MNLRNQMVLGVVLLGSGLAGSAFGQSFMARSTIMRYSYVYGAGADTHVGDGDIVGAEMLASDSDATWYSGSTSGILPNGLSYSAGTDVELSYSYSIEGPLTNFQSITASGSSEVSAGTSGAGLASMSSANPGNEVTLTFHVPSPARYHLVGEINLPEPSFWSTVRLEYFNGFFWGSVFHSYFNTPLGMGAFDVSGTLLPGDYRVAGNITLSAFGNASGTGDFQFQFSVERPGDMNCDGYVNGEDVQAFATAALDSGEFEATYEGCPILNGDFDGNQAVTIEDADEFVECVLNGSCL